MPSKKQRAKAKKQKKVPQQKVPRTTTAEQHLFGGGDIKLYFYKGTPVSLDLSHPDNHIKTHDKFHDWIMANWIESDRDLYIRQLEHYEKKIRDNSKDGVYDAGNPPLTFQECVVYCGNVIWLVEKGHLPNNNLYGYLEMRGSKGGLSFHGL